MRVKHNLWRVSNGWLLIPEDVIDPTCIRSEEAAKCAVFTTLKEFADQYPKRERKRSRTNKTVKPWRPGEPDPLTGKETHANIA